MTDAVTNELVAKCKKLHSEVFGAPSFSSGTIAPSSTGLPGALSVVALAGQKDVAQSANHSNLYSFTLLPNSNNNKSNNSGSDSATVIPAGFPVDLGSAKLFSIAPSGKRLAVFRTQLKANKTRWFVELWTPAGIEKIISVGDNHDAVYEEESTFGCVRWSADESKLLYVAEKKFVEPTSWFDSSPSAASSSSGSSTSTSTSISTSNTADSSTSAATAAAASAETSSSSSAAAAASSAPAAGAVTASSNKRVGRKYETRESWGEGHATIFSPVPVVLDLDSESFTLPLSDIPEADLHSYGQAQWAPDGQGVVFVRWSSSARRLGIKYCFNRPSDICYVRLPAKAASTDKSSSSSSSSSSPDKTLRVLSVPGTGSRSPVFTPDGAFLLWLENKASGPHCASSKLLCVPWPAAITSAAPSQEESTSSTSPSSASASSSSPSALTIPAVITPTVVTDVAQDDRTAITLYRLTSACWLDSRRLLFSTPHRSQLDLAVVDISPVTSAISSGSASSSLSSSSAVTVEPKLLTGTADASKTAGSYTLLSVYGGKYVLVAHARIEQSPSLLLGELGENGDGSVKAWTVLVAGRKFGKGN